MRNDAGARHVESDERRDLKGFSPTTPAHSHWQPETRQDRLFDRFLVSPLKSRSPAIKNSVLRASAIVLPEPRATIFSPRPILYRC